ncbi:integrase core domain-containing protein [Enemella evansiae]|uniref:integrase core domain-containing protein n=1 Tax=Enemella evansiae TaxID=2016499 RepID=UPI003982EB46
MVSGRGPRWVIATGDWLCLLGVVAHRCGRDRAAACGHLPRWDTVGVIFHADRGCQYTSTQLAEVADQVGVRLSVGRTGVCWDNAQQESFWSTLKTEFYQRYSFTTRAEAITRSVAGSITSTTVAGATQRSARSPGTLRGPDHHTGHQGRLKRCPRNGVNPNQATSCYTIGCRLKAES